MVTLTSVKKELSELGLAVENNAGMIEGALYKEGVFFKGPPFSIDYKDDQWRVILGMHLAKWGRINFFENLADALEFIKTVYLELPDFLANGWKPNLKK